MTDGQIRAAIADDDRLVRAGIVSILRYDAGIDVVIEADDGGDLIRQVGSRHVDVILLDVRMPGLDGLSALDELSRMGITSPAAMLSTFSNDDYVADAIAKGAKGFLLKSDAPDALIRHIHDLVDGGAVFSPRVAAWLVRSRAVEDFREQRDAEARAANLTDRQREILDQLATGAGNAEIAARLHLSEGTVKQYLRSMFMVLGVENRVQAALLGYRARH